MPELRNSWSPYGHFLPESALRFLIANRKQNKPLLVMEIILPEVEEKKRSTGAVPQYVPALIEQ
jgi:hypothetical protein